MTESSAGLLKTGPSTAQVIDLIFSNVKIKEQGYKYAKYFELSETPVRGIKITPKQDAITRTEKDYGFFALLSNDIKDPIKALEIYRNKDLVEKAL